MRHEQAEQCLSMTTTVKDWFALHGVLESTMFGWMSKFRKEEPELFGESNASEWIKVTCGTIALQTTLAKPGVAAVKEEAGDLAAGQGDYISARPVAEDVGRQGALEAPRPPLSAHNETCIKEVARYVKEIASA